MTSRSEWDWELTDGADRQLARLDPELRNRVVGKLDEVVNDEWRPPPAFLEPVRGSPYDTLRVGHLRLGCIVDDDNERLVVASIRSRDGAYEGDD